MVYFSTSVGMSRGSRALNWRASLVPAAAVIPAPRVYIHVAAVKMFVVEYKCRLIMLNNRRMI